MTSDVTCDPTMTSDVTCSYVTGATTITTTKTVVKKEVMSSPTLDKEEPVRLSRYPDGQKGDRLAAIERDDWPAPPEPAAAYPELRTLFLINYTPIQNKS